MSNIPASLRRASRCTLAVVLLLATSPARGLSAAVAAGADETPAQPRQQQQQRPRRVGPAPTQGGGAASDAKDASDAKGAKGASDARQSPSSSPRRDAGGEAVDEDDVVRIDTQLVSVPAVVTDGRGKPVAGLRAADFTLFEDGRPQKIANFATTEAPFEVALLLDTSGSTRAEVGLIRRAAHAFVESLRPGDRVAVLAFSTREEGTTKLATVEIKSPLTDDREQLREAVEGIGVSYGTPFYDGLERVAAEVFRDAPRAELRGRRALVALTDGVDSTSESDYEEARARFKRAGVVAYFVQVNTEEFVEDRLMRDCRDDGALRLSRSQLQRYRRLFATRADAADYANFCRMGQFERMDISRRLYQLAREEMNELARDSGGKTFPVGDLREARSAFRQVAEEIGTQYSLGYYPTNKARDGSFRTIRVQIRGVRDAQVRAREGYQAPRS